MTNKMNPVVHFEMPYNDRDRMCTFYEKAFGWKTNKLGQEMGNYVVAMTTELDEKNKFPKEPGRINGGFYKASEDPLSRVPSFVIAVDNIEEAMKKVTDAGGTIKGSSNKENPMKPDMIPGVGLYISVIDTEGNRVSLLQPDPMM